MPNHRLWRMRIVVAVTTVTSLTLIFPPQTALAARAPAQPSPEQCLNAFDDDGDDYVGDGWVGATVERSNGWQLGCGDELSGVIHIAHPESSGSVHPITSATEGDFLTCWAAAVRNGVAAKQSDGRTTITWQPTKGGKVAFGYFATDRKFTITFYTRTGGKSNDWHGCARAANGSSWK